MALQQLYGSSLSLLTDLYQLTMAYGYWKNDMHEREVVFHHFFRKQPFKGNYTIACGLHYLIDFVEQFRFSEDDLAYLATLKGSDQTPLFEAAFLDYLRDFRFDADIDAVEEGTVVFPHMPMVRVKGKLLACQLLETALLNIVNFQTLIATKAARICMAAKGEAVLEFGLRRAHGIDGGLAASRAAYVGGCAATSNVLAGKLFDVPVKGTHAHSWVMSYETELQAFEMYAEAMPNNCIFLVDTYDTVEGVKKAIQVGKKLREKGYEMLGIRLDSGDLADLSMKARKLLDEAGFSDARIVASNDLDEYRIQSLKEKGATINVWGVGTRLSTAYDQPALGGVYKLAAIRQETGEWDYKIKLSEQAIKTSNPGCLQVRRMEEDGVPVVDVMYDEWEGLDESYIDFKDQQKHHIDPTKGTDLLRPIFRKGKCVYEQPSIHEMREKSLEQAALFHTLTNYQTGLDTHTTMIKDRLRKGEEVSSKIILNG